MPKTKSKNLFFDFDGVIADSLDSVAKIHTDLAKQFGKEVAVSADFLRENWRSGWQELYTSSYGFTRDELPLTVPVYRAMATEAFQSVKPFEGMDALIRKLAKRHTLLILSGNYSDIIYGALGRAGISECFSTIFGADDMPGIDKSDPRFYLIPIDELNIEKESVVVIGDGVQDILGAKKAGLPIIACSWGWQLRDWLVDEKPDYLADNPEELLAIIEEL